MQFFLRFNIFLMTVMFVLLIPASEESDENVPEERAMLFEEAKMPLEELLMKYGVPAVVKMGQDSLGG